MTDRGTCGECGTSLVGDYCHNCGQADRDFDLELRPLISEAFETFFAFDFRLLETLRLLLVSPGALTKAFIDGKRRRYVPPFKLYLGISIVAFLFLSLSGGSVLQINETREDVEIVDEAVVQEGRLQAEQVQRAGSQQEDPEEPPGILGMLIESEIEDLGDDPEPIQKAYLQMLPKAVFALVPVFGLLLGAAHFRRRRPFAHHLIFSLHIHALGFLIILLGSIVVLISESVGDIAQAIGMLWLLIAFVRAQRLVYGGSLGKTILKTVPLMIVYLFVLLFAMLIGLAIVLISM